MNEDHKSIVMHKLSVFSSTAKVQEIKDLPVESDMYRDYMLTVSVEIPYKHIENIKARVIQDLYCNMRVISRNNL